MDSKEFTHIRKKLNKTQREMADRLGTRQQTISEWEVGLYKPRGASSTLLSVVAERAEFEYGKTAKKPAGD